MSPSNKNFPDARKVIVAAIKAVGQALIAISNVLLAAFPGLKARFQNAIRKTVDKAVATVNKVADGLKQAVQKALDLLGAALDKALSLLEKGLDAVIDAASAVVQGAIKAAQAVVLALGTWAKLIKDVASGPGAWLKKLGAAVFDGIKHHLWSAFKTTVIDWFKNKVFELLGVGGIILELLLEGGLTKEHIIQMALDALMVAIPAALVAILRARGGCAHGDHRGPPGRVGHDQPDHRRVQRVHGVPARGQGRRRRGAVRRGARLGRGRRARLRRQLAAQEARQRRPQGRRQAQGARGEVQGQAQGQGAAQAPRRARRPSGRQEPQGPRRARRQEAARRTDDKHPDGKPKSKEERRKEEIAKKVEKAQRELPPKIQSLLAKKPSRLRAKATFLLWRAQYGLRSLEIEGKGAVKFKATINPTLDLGNGWQVTWDDVIRAIHEVSQEYFDSLNGKAGTGAGTAGQPLTIRREENPARVAAAVSEKQGVVDVGSGVRASHGDHPNKPGTTSIFEVGRTEETPPGYQRMMKDLEGVDVGRAFGQLLRGEEVDVPLDKKPKLGVLFVTMFGMEPTHPQKSMGHKRDLIYAMMATQLLEKREVTLESLLTKKPEGKDLVDKESNKLPAVGIEFFRTQPIQAGTQAVTRTVIGGDGYGSEDLPKTMLAEKIRLQREINLFTRWIQATGELETLEGRSPGKEDLKNEIRKRLREFLSKGKD